MSESFLNGRVTVVVGDLTKQVVDAIVNAANSSLLGGAGVDGAIHNAGGPAILEACQEIRRTRLPNGLSTGNVVMTTAGKLPSKFVIHTVGPIKGSFGSRESELLADCYTNSLALAKQNGIKTIAFPSISTGAFGYPRDEAAAVSTSAIADFLSTDDSLLEVRLVFYSESDRAIFLEHHRFEKADT